MAKRGLTVKQELFVQEYLRCDNAAEAYRIAYPGSEKWTVNALNVNAHRNLHKPNISLRIKSIKEAAARKIAKKYEITLERLTKEYARIAFLDFSIFFDNQGQLIPIQEMSADAKASLAGLETVIVGGGDQVDYIKKIKTYDKLKALGDLAKHLGFFKEDNEQGKEKVVIYNNIELPQEMQNLIPLKR